MQVLKAPRLSDYTLTMSQETIYLKHASNASNTSSLSFKAFSRGTDEPYHWSCSHADAWEKQTCLWVLLGKDCLIPAQRSTSHNGTPFQLPFPIAPSFHSIPSTSFVSDMAWWRFPAHCKRNVMKIIRR